MENEKMRRSWERRLAALEARARDALPVNRLLIPCIIRPDACSARPNPCSFDDVAPENRARVVDLQEWRSCSARRCIPSAGRSTIAAMELITTEGCTPR